MKIRPYEPADWEKLCEIHDRARRDELRLTVGESAFLSLEQTAENEGLFDGQLAVAEVDGLPVGFVAYTDDEITWLYVSPAAYRRGIGRRLVEHVLQARNRVRVEVLEGNDAALALYRESGFRVVERKAGRLAGNEAFPAAGFILEYEQGGARPVDCDR